MTAQGFVVSHAQGATFERGLRSFYAYRDLGIKAATAGRVDARVIRAAAGTEFSGVTGVATPGASQAAQAPA
jgi:hypothetical protein